MPSPRYLTKSRFKLAIECPTKLYYVGKKNIYANTMNDNEFMAMLADGGFQVGELAKLAYPEGIEINTLDVQQAIVQTQALMGQPNITLFEPAIQFGRYLVRVDVLVKRGHVIEVIEVKAKSYSGKPSGFSGKRTTIAGEFLPYVQDVAFQKWVVQQAFPQATVSAYLLMPDKSKTAHVNGLNQWFKVKRQGQRTEVWVDERARQPGLANSMLTCVGVDHLVNEVLANPMVYPGGQDTLSVLADRWSLAYEQDKPIAPVIGGQCGSCEFKAPIGGELKSGFHECWSSVTRLTPADIEAGTVLDVWNFRGKDALIKQGKFKLSSVTESDLKLNEAQFSPLSHAQRQWLQVNGLPPEDAVQGFYLDREGLAVAMSHWTFPLHLIDFETASVALPFHRGRRPYEQVAFQFSHHVMQADGTLHHADEFLSDTPGEFPNYAFARALMRALSSDNGTIMRWSHHENSILKAIKIQLQEDAEPPNDVTALIAFIDSITTDGARAMVDLAEIARKHYFHPMTKGSCSIKKMLPAVMASSAFLQFRYRQPIYGAVDGIPSLNFQNIAWWQADEKGQVRDPYHLLTGELDDSMDEDNPGINQGGAASYAYLRLQFEDLSDSERLALRRGLLRYCELDSLAMGFVLTAFLNSPEFICTHSE